MTGALLLATPGDTRWVAGVAPILRDLGFDVHTDTPAPNAAADIGLVIAGAATGIPDTLLRAWRATGPVCAVVLPAAAVPVPGADEAVIACLREPVTEAAILAMLARQHYLALSQREAAGIAPAIAAQTFGNRAFAAELVHALVTATQGDLAKLRAADGALETVRSVAHRVKASPTTSAAMACVLSPSAWSTPPATAMPPTLLRWPRSWRRRWRGCSACSRRCHRKNKTEAVAGRSGAGIHRIGPVRSVDYARIYRGINFQYSGINGAD